MKTKIKTETMKDLTKIYLDLSKCTEEQINKIYSIIKNDNIDLFTRSRLRSGHTFKSYFLINEGDWVLTQVDYKLSMRTELTYPEFIKLFEGVDDYSAKRLQPLFNHLNQEHGLTLLESEMDEIIRIVGSLNSNQ